METAFRKFMQAQTEVAALLGGVAAFRWYPAMIPQGKSLPAVRFRADTLVPTEAYDQSGAYEFCKTTLQIQIVSTDYDECKTVWAAIRRVIRNWHRQKANTADGAIGGVYVQSLVIADGPSDDFDPPIDAGKQGFHYVDVSLEITHQEED